MEFGFVSYAEIRPGSSDSFSLLCEEARAAEEAGFDHYGLIEHHQAVHGEFSSPIPWMAAVAARTERIRVGTTLILLPLYHPVRLAEDLASVDIISGGRLFVAVGLGYQERDFASFGIPMRERVGRFTEVLEVLQQAWQPEPLSYHGKFFSLDQVQVQPKPLKGRIPLWGGGMVEHSVRRIARGCDAWLTSTRSRPSELDALARVYRETARASGKEPRILLCRNGWVADSFEQARAELEPSMLEHYRAVQRHTGAPPGQPGPTLPDRPTGDHTFILGSPEDCIRRIDFYRERLGIDGLILRMRTPYGPDQALVLRAIAQFGREVIGHYRDGRPTTDDGR